MKSFEKQSIYVRDAIRGAFILFAMGIGWQALKSEVVVLGGRVEAVENDVSGNGGLAEKVEMLTIEQAVMNTKLDNIDENMKEDKEAILDALRRIEDKVDRR